MNKYLLSLLLLLPITFTFAQDEASEEEVEDVVVLGVKQSLIDAIELKRSKVGVTEAITAEDIGKFPDQNLAESLARISGVTIDRSNVEGSRVNVRGLGSMFNRVRKTKWIAALDAVHLLAVGLGWYLGTLHPEWFGGGEWGALQGIVWAKCGYYVLNLGVLVKAVIQHQDEDR